MYVAFRRVIVHDVVRIPVNNAIPKYNAVTANTHFIDVKPFSRYSVLHSCFGTFM